MVKCNILNVTLFQGHFDGILTLKGLTNRRAYTQKVFSNQVLANDCYRMGQFWHAAKAFDMLERLDPSPEYWEGKRGACAGVFQLIIAGKQPK